jgi:hypothetical protein
LSVFTIVVTQTVLTIVRSTIGTVPIMLHLAAAR